MENDFKNALKENLNIEIEDEIFQKVLIWQKEFIEYNAHTNLMSKKDVDFLYEKHLFDSLAIVKWNNFSNIKTILDVGTGGGFPSVILAIFFPKIKIIANDSRIKKINFIKHVKEVLKLDNLEICYSRIEDIEPLNVDLIVSRAVGKLYDVYMLSKKHLKKQGYFLSYKSKLVSKETDDFKSHFKNAKFEIIPYKLPLKENFERNLVVLINR